MDDAVIVEGPLSGMVVLDLTDTEPGLFAGALLADMGAQVVRVGDAGVAPDVEPFRAALLRNRRIAPSVTDGMIRASAAVVFDGDEALSAAAKLDLREARAINPALVACGVTPLGLESPWADRFAGDLSVQALSGFMELTGEPGRPPIRMGARVLPLLAGAEAALAVISCLRQGAGALGTTIDMSVLDVALNTLSYMAPMYLTLGQVPGRVGSGHTTIYPYNAFEVADGWIVAAPFTQRFWRNFCAALGSPEWAEDERFRDFQRRLDNRALLEPMLNARMKTRTRADWLTVLEAADVPCGPVNSVAEALAMEHSRARGLVVDLQDAAGTAGRCLGFPLKFSSFDGAAYTPPYRAKPVAPETAPSAPRVPAPGTGPVKPLAGIRILDLTRMAAGPYCTQLLVDLGAEVIKVEEPRIGDPTRRNVPMIGSMSSYFYAFNRGKQSVALDMKTKEGNGVVRRLMGEVDVVVENFRPGVMERLGLDYQRIKTRNPRLVFASISGFGQTGPLREKISFDLVNQAVAGMLSITSEPGRGPVRIGMAVGDLGGGLFAALGIVAALNQRDRTGAGAYIDISLHDVLVTLLGGVAQDYLATGEIPAAMGSEHPCHVPEAAFATADGWLVLEAWTDEGWRGLAAEPDFEALADPRFSTLSGRVDQRADVHQLIGAVLAAGTTDDWLVRLRKPGIGVAPVCSVAAALDADHVTARDLVLGHTLADGSVGRTIGSAFRLNGAPVVSAHSPPQLGEHGAAILERLGLGSVASL